MHNHLGPIQFSAPLGPNQMIQKLSTHPSYHVKSFKGQ